MATPFSSPLTLQQRIAQLQTAIQTQSRKPASTGPISPQQPCSSTTTAAGHPMPPALPPQPPTQLTSPSPAQPTTPTAASQLAALGPDAQQQLLLTAQHQAAAALQQQQAKAQQAQAAAQQAAQARAIEAQAMQQAHAIQQAHATQAVLHQQAIAAAAVAAQHNVQAAAFQPFFNFAAINNLAAVAAASGGLHPFANLGKKCRRSRTVFSEEQLEALEMAFKEKKYLSTPDRAELAERLGLTQVQVKTWYQNRRMKWKKQCRGNDQPSTSAAAPEQSQSISNQHGGFTRISNGDESEEVDCAF